MRFRGGKPLVYGDPFVTGGGTPAWNPVALSPLVWLVSADAATITLSGSNVTAWADKGSAAGSWTQSTSANQPTYSASDLGYPGVRSSGAVSSEYLQRSNPTSYTEMEILVVYEQDFDPASSTSKGGLWRIGSSAQNTIMSYPGNQHIYDDAGSTTRRDTGTRITPLTSPVCYSVVSTASEWTSYLNFAQQYTTATNTVGTDTMFYIGASYATAPLDGVIRELLVFDRKLSSGERSDVHAYFSAKWGVP